MKKMKKLLVLILSVLMVLGTSATVFAEPVDVSDTYKVAKVEVSGIKTGNTLKLYKIVQFNLDSATNEFSYTLATGLPTAYNSVEKLAALTPDGYSLAEDSTIKAAADTLANEIAEGHITPIGNAVTATAANNKATIENLPAGWYVAVVSGTADDSIIYQNMIIDAMPKVDSANNTYEKADDVSFDVKHTTDTVTKTVGSEKAESTDEYSVGDTVPFEITTNIPNYPNPSKVATFEISDAPSDLTDDKSSIVVTVNDATVAAGASTFSIAENGADGFKIVFVKDYILTHPGQSVKVNYNATIKSTATIADSGLTADNTAKIKFNPNPNETGTVEPGDTTEVYTYGVDVFKKDSETNQKLTGAKFVLYKADGQTVAGPETEVDANGYVSWNGLAAGTYKLVETKAPTGYKLDSTPKEITISKTTANKDNRQSASVTETNFLQTDVPNEQGSTLPSTGGMGTTILYIIGGALVVGCAIMLVAKKRTENK